MTLRGGGTRDDRSQAHPLEPASASGDDWSAPPTPRPASPTRRDTGSRDGGNGARNGADGSRPVRRSASGSAHAGHGILRFGLFTLGMVALVIVLFATVLRPVAAAGLADWAIGNPATWKLPVLGDIVAEALSDELAAKASDDSTEVVWPVESGDTVDTVGDRLLGDKLILSRPAFAYAAMQANLGDKLQAGNFQLRHDMTPPEVVRALIEDRVVKTTVDVTFREGLRIEQMTAKLQTVASRVDSKEFYDIATKPPATLLADYAWLDLPEGASLEGYLYPATYTLRTDDLAPTDAEHLIRMMLDEFAQQVGTERMSVPEARGLSFREILTLASIVEKEAVVDAERPLIAGVYQNRLDRELLLGADPTVIYAADGAALDAMPFEDWQTYFFGKVPSGPLRDVALPEPWAEWNTYKLRGMPPGPICSPTVASIDAALSPDTKDKYLYFVAIPNGGGKHDFSKTLAEHEEKLRKYGYL